MRMKGVFVLALVVCCTALCSGEDGSVYDYGISDISSNELAADYLLRADDSKNDTDEENTKIDPCNPNPCLNEGTCKSNNEDEKLQDTEPFAQTGPEPFSCHCTGNYTGNTCEKNVCEGDPCKNGGTCSKESEQRKCTCVGTFTGETCQTNVCDGDPCKNGGTCSKESEQRKCTCVGTFTGDICEKNVCDGDPCKNGGKCSKEAEKRKCFCVGNWAGETCETKCDCGPKGTCQLDNGQKKCECEQGFADKDGTCTETCDDGECEYDSECAPSGDFHFCNCTKGLSGDKCKTIDDCGDDKKFKNCKSERGTCIYDESKKEATCDCDQGKELDPTVNYCKETCDSNDDCNGGTCDKNFCKCKSGYEGDTCKTLTDCTSGKYKNCVLSGGNCSLEGTKTVCKCLGNKKLDQTDLKNQFCREKCSSNSCKNGALCKDELCVCKKGTEGDDCGLVTECENLKCQDKEATCKYDFNKNPNTFCECDNANYAFVTKEERCVEKCKADSDCLNGAKCNTQTKLCDCKPNTSGDKCEIINGCDPLNCTTINAECVYDVSNTKATCKCIDKSYYYENEKCNHEWCKYGCPKAISDCAVKNGIAVCTCKNKKSYYDYTTKTCTEIDKCLGVNCSENQVCYNGVCKCDSNYKLDNGTCERANLCSSSKCFPDAKCEEGSDVGFVKCSCKSDTDFYLNGRCQDSSCFINVPKKECKKSCPPGMIRKDGECQYNKEENKCNADCGFLGWCFNTSNNVEDCRCDPNYAEKDPSTKKCVLKASVVCPTKERNGVDSCKCQGKYKLAKNGKTCELKSCSDADVQNDCKNRRAAYCAEDWKNDKGYTCVCPDGYIDDKEKGCIDPCSLDNMKDLCSTKGQVCYIGIKDRVGDCRCPPTFTYDTSKASCDISGGSTFMIPGLPVLKKAYEVGYNNINKVALNRDVIVSMMMAYNNLEFAQLFNFKEEKDVLRCDVWLQFKPAPSDNFNASLEIKRWVNQLKGIKKHLLLPPRLQLSRDIFKALSEEQLTLCTSSVQQVVCGTGSTCSNDKGCSCKNGYREIESTLKISGGKRLVRCEDIDQCLEKSHNCSANSQCVPTHGDFICVCNSGYKKEKGAADALNKEACVDLCHSNPCGKGTCKVTKEFTVDCTCPKGSTGSFCNKEDVNLAAAGKATQVVGAVLGTLLAIVIILIIVYIVRQRKNSYSEDFAPAPRIDNAEMAERRPMRGVTNRAYQ